MTLTFGFDPAAGYTNPYTVVAYGNSNSELPIGQVRISGYGSHVTGSIDIGSNADSPHTLKIFTDLCPVPVGQIII